MAFKKGHVRDFVSFLQGDPRFFVAFPQTNPSNLTNIIGDFIQFVNSALQIFFDFFRPVSPAEWVVLYKSDRTKLWIFTKSAPFQTQNAGAAGPAAPVFSTFSRSGGLSSAAILGQSTQLPVKNYTICICLLNVLYFFVTLPHPGCAGRCA